MALKKDYWEKMVSLCNAEILSEISNSECTAYLLSESSLFVWKDRFLMITCGETILVNSIFYFLEEFKVENISSLIYQRKNEYLSSKQKTTFEEDVEKIKTKVSGVSLRFGNLDEHHNYMFYLDQKSEDTKGDYTTELLMYHIQKEALHLFNKENLDLKKVQNFLKLNEKLSGFTWDEHLFKPTGYSLNGISGKNYLTIHVTPLKENSYISFETNLNLKESYPNLLNEILDIFKPVSFDTINFNTEVNLNTSDAIRVSRIEDSLSCGYEVYFAQYTSVRDKVEKPFYVGN